MKKQLAQYAACTRRTPFSKSTESGTQRHEEGDVEVVRLKVEADSTDNDVHQTNECCVVSKRDAQTPSETVDDILILLVALGPRLHDT